MWLIALIAVILSGTAALFAIADRNGGPHSPDGQFIYASSLDTSIIYVFDIKTQRS
jgi:hypothetical protein